MVDPIHLYGNRSRGASGLLLARLLAGCMLVQEGASLRCPGCGFDNPEGLKVCGECGTAVTASCPTCGFVHYPQFKFCGDYGASLITASRTASASSLATHPQSPSRYTPAYLAEKILTSKAILEGEPNRVTVLFPDLKGSMELLADRDPEDARALLDPVLERMMAAVRRYEGTVNQVMGVASWRSLVHP